MVCLQFVQRFFKYYCWFLFCCCFCREFVLSVEEHLVVMTDVYSRNFLRVHVALLVFYFIGLVGFRSQFLSLYGVKVGVSWLMWRAALYRAGLFLFPFFSPRALTCASW